MTHHTAFTQKRIDRVLDAMEDGLAYCPSVLHSLTGIDRTGISNALRVLRQKKLIFMIGRNGAIHYYSRNKDLPYKKENLAQDILSHAVSALPVPTPLMQALFAHKSTFHSSKSFS
ncbi:hypothetical protein [Flavobacterium sp.]|uniref:hypothetical protein n=1 Tax=Flavobacterium sp. TaxID=239 RepID=UPI002621FB07|nr:hypothetical protein [Flavobacterium sp.]